MVCQIRSIFTLQNTKKVKNIEQFFRKFANACTLLELEHVDQGENCKDQRNKFFVKNETNKLKLCE